MAKDKTIDTELLAAAKKLFEERKNPLLLLDLENVDHLNFIKLEMELGGKHFKELDVILHTSGGLIEPAFNTVKLLRASADKVNIIVPHYAKSAGTLMSLGADELIMNTMAELGPLDVQIREIGNGDGSTHKSALNGFKALEQIRQHALENLDIATKLILERTGGNVTVAEAIKLGIDFSGKTSGCLYSQIDPKMMGEYARALEVGGRYAIMILTRYLNWEYERAENISNQLVFNYPSHGFIIDTQELQRLGLPAKSVENSGRIKEILDELKLCFIRKDIQGGSIVKLYEEAKTDDVVAPAKKVAQKAVKKK